MKWENVYIFISSTFNDMHAERDYLVKRVFPELRLWCNKRKLKLIDVDLRWGVSEKDATENKRVLEVCLNNVDKCRPFFLCMLGQRRGWIPGLTDINEQTMMHFPMIQDYLGKYSITELEIIHALLKPFDRDQSSARYAFFYSRNEDYLEDIEEGPLKKIFYDPEELKQNQENLSWFRETIKNEYPFTTYDAVWNKNKRSFELSNVKGEDLSKGRLDQLHVGEQSLADHILEQLKSAIYKEFPDHFVEDIYEDDLQNELSEQATFLFNAYDSYITRKEEEQAILDYIKGDCQRPLAISANAGNGKTSMLANIIWNWNLDMPIFYRFVSTSKGSRDVQDTLYFVLLEMSRHGLISEKLVEENKYDLMLQFPNLLEKIGEKPCCIVLDAVDQWTHVNENSMRWIPSLLPPGVKLIISIKSDTNEQLIQKIQKKNVQFYHLGGLCRRKDKITLIKTYLSQFLKDIDENQIERILSLKGSSNPLYLKIVLNELRIHGSFDTLLELLKKDYGNTPIEAFYVVLGRLEKELFSDLIRSKDLVMYVLGLTAYSLEGIRFEEFVSVFRTYADIQETCSDEDIIDAVHGLCRHLAPYLVIDDGRVNFLYDSFRQAAKSKYIDMGKEFHDILAAIYEKYCGLNEKTEEIRVSDITCLFYHAIECSKEWAEKVLSNAEFLVELIRKTSAARAAEYYTLAESRYPRLREAKKIAELLRKQAARIDINPTIIFEALDKIGLYSISMIDHLVRDAGEMDLEYYKLVHPKDKYIYEPDQEMKICSVNEKDTSLRTVIFGKFMAVYGYDDNYVVLQNLETGEIERQVRLRKNIKEIILSENRLDVKYQSGKKAAKEQDLEESFREELHMPEVESFLIPSMESVCYIDKWPDPPKGFSWNPFIHVYDGNYYVTACSKTDNVRQTEIYCVNKDGMEKCIQFPKSEFDDSHWYKQEEYLFEESKKGKYRQLWHIPSGKLLHEEQECEEGFWACTEGNRLWYFNKYKQNDEFRIKGYIYEKYESEIKLIYEHTFSREESRYLKYVSEVIVCKNKVFFVKAEGVLCVCDEKMNLIGSIEISARLDTFLVLVYADGWNHFLQRYDKYLLIEDKNRLLFFDSEKLIQSIKYRFYPMLSEGYYQSVQYGNKLFFMEFNDLNFRYKKILTIDLKTNMEKEEENKKGYDYDIDNRYEYTGADGVTHTCIMGYSRENKKLSLYSLDRAETVFEMDINCSGNYYHGCKPFLLEDKFAVIECNEAPVPKNEEGTEAEGYWSTNNVYYYEKGNAEPIDKWETGNVFQDFQTANVIIVRGIPYYLSRSNVVNNNNLDEVELQVFDLSNKKVIGTYVYNQKNDTMNHNNYVKLMDKKICLYMKRHNHPVRNGEYKITFDPVEEKWEEIFLTDESVLKETENLLFWQKKDTSDICVEDMKTRKIIGTLKCASNAIRTVIVKNDEYIVIHVAGMCEVFSAVTYERKFIQMLDTNFINWFSLEGTDKIGSVSEYLVYCIYERKNTKELAKKRYFSLESLDDLFA